MPRPAAWLLPATVVLLAAGVAAACADDPDETVGPDEVADEPGDAPGGAPGGAPGDAPVETEEPEPAPDDADDLEFEPLPTPQTPEIEEPDAPEGPDPDAVAAHGVSAGHPAAVDVGMEVLDNGGNAVDAAIATAYAVSVVEPFGSGLGGGGVTLVHPHGEPPIALDYRDVVAQNGQVPASNIGIPGFVAGMESLRETHGTADRDELVAPAIALAEDGVDTSRTLADWLRASAHRLPTQSLGHFFPGGAALAQGDALVQEQLAGTLRRISDEGAEAFYAGDLGDELAGAVDGIDVESLAAYEVAETPPASGSFAGYELYSSGPPLAGGALIGLLQMTEALGVDELEPGSADFVHAVAIAWRLAEQRLNWNVGDPAFVDVPLDELTDADANAALAEQIDMGAVLPIDPGQPDGGVDTEGASTTHITVVDADGTMVSMTNTLRNFWGSGRYALGFFLNDQLHNFGQRPGSPNDPPEAGKRTVASSAPVIVADVEQRPVLGAGTPGGRRIPTVLANVLLRWGVHGEDLEDAIAAPRVHMSGGVLQTEQPLAQDVANDLRGRGHGQISQPPSAYHFGSVQALELDHDADGLRGARDERRDADWRVEDL